MQRRVWPLVLALACLPLLVAGMQRSLIIEEEYLENEKPERKEKLTFKWLKDNKGEIAGLFADATGSPLISSILKVPLLAIPKEDKLQGIRSEMTALNTRLDTLYEEVKWASNGFQKLLNNIETAWLKYQPIQKNEDALKSTFCPFYAQYLGSASILHKLISKQETDEESLANVLAKKLKCHEKRLDARFLHVRKLLCQGNEMDQKYYELMGLDEALTKTLSDSELILQKSNLALFNAQLRCISNSALYIKRDIIEHISDKVIHEDLGQNIHTFLKDKYERYDWLVVAFTTHLSEGRARFMKRHVFSGFTGIERGSVTVAVARQLKGNHKGTQGIIKQITGKFKEKLPACSEMEERLEEMGLMDHITAVHVHQRHRDQKKKEEQQEDDRLDVSAVSGENSDFTITGECTRREETAKNGQYTIMIKSDEERAGQKPCLNFDCGKEGECKEAPRTRIPVCHCKGLFYGPHCENHANCPIVTDLRSRKQPS